MFNYFTGEVMKKIVALVALLGISSLANAAFRAEGPVSAARVVDVTPVRQDIITTAPGAVYVEETGPVAVTSPADTRYYGPNYYNRPVAGTVAGATETAADVVEGAGAAAASVIPF